jgi:hypothetical protein
LPSRTLVVATRSENRLFATLENIISCSVVQLLLDKTQIVVDARVIALKLQYAGLKLMAWMVFQNNGKVLWPGDANPGAQRVRTDGDATKIKL